MRDPRLTKLADVLVNYSLAVKAGQMIRLSSPEPGIPLLLELYREVLKAGAHPLVRVSLAEAADIFAREANDEQLVFTPTLASQELEAIDGHIALWAETNTRSMTKADPARMAKMSAARRPISQRFLQRAAEGTLKWVGTQMPTHASAQDAEMSLEEYEDFVFRAGLLHHPDPAASWRKLSEAQQRLADFVSTKSDYRVTAPNGTDIRMSVAGRQWVNCDGHENFPDGEVFTGPIEDSVNGTVVYSFPAVHHGREVVGARLTFKHGRVVDASASKGEDFLISMLDTDAGARTLGECAIGTNYAITQYTRNTLFDEKIGGTVHFAVGAGYPETGNTNTSGLHWDMVLDLRQGGEISFDGEVISRSGTFLREGFPR